MAQFLVRVLTQCGVPSMTPDVENALAELPKRMLYEPPPFMSALLARAGVVDVPPGKSVEESARAAARAVLPAGFALDLLPRAFSHREVNGTYMQSVDGGELTFIVGAPEGSDVVATATQQSHRLPVAGSTTTKTVTVEFRCHLVVKPL